MWSGDGWGAKKKKHEEGWRMGAGWDMSMEHQKKQVERCMIGIW